jgi:hypothetical protein
MRRFLSKLAISAAGAFPASSPKVGPAAVAHRALQILAKWINLLTFGADGQGLAGMGNSEL